VSGVRFAAFVCLAGAFLFGCQGAGDVGSAGAGAPAPGGLSPGAPFPTASTPGTTCLGVSPGHTGTIGVDVGSDARTAAVHVPDQPQDPSAVVVVLHGYGDTSAVVDDMTGFSGKGETEGFVTVFPQGAGNPPAWDVAGDGDIGFLGQLLAMLVADPCVDAARIYVAGISMGGAMANVVGCRLADEVAAIASVSGLYGPNWGGQCTPARPVPVIAFHGVEDPIVPYDGGAIVDPEVGQRPEFPPVIGAEAWAAGWAQRNGCDGDPVEQPAIGKVVPIFWDSCHAPVRLYRITDGGHTWPGSHWDEPLTNRDISATKLIWDFFSQFSLAEG
jgi:polyhydroxybutyrate depolymerase